MYQHVSKQASCLACLPGQHNANTGATACQKCLAGTFMRNSGSVDVSCHNCPLGFANNVNESTNCVPNPQGSYMVPALNGGMDFVLCPPGHYCSGGAASKVACSPGSEAESEGAVVCLFCTPGQFTANDSTVNCEVCPPMHYAGRENQTACLQCALGKKTEDGQTGATSCQSCGAGEYGAVYALCEPGLFRAGSDSDSTVCKNCPNG